MQGKIKDRGRRFCPVCGGVRVGKLNGEQFFCWDCLLEFNRRREVFSVQEDGALQQLRR